MRQEVFFGNLSAPLERSTIQWASAGDAKSTASSLNDDAV